MNFTSVILTAAFIFTIFIIGFAVYSIYVSKKDIFHGSGKPEKMASMVLESIYLMAKNIVGIFIVTTIMISMSEKLLSIEQGLPIVSLVVGYLLGKEFNQHKDS
jgi:hypothetical protein